MYFIFCTPVLTDINWVSFLKKNFLWRCVKILRIILPKSDDKCLAISVLVKKKRCVYVFVWVCMCTIERIQISSCSIGLTVRLKQNIRSVSQFLIYFAESSPM